jgi:hypothetical protein
MPEANLELAVFLLQELAEKPLVTVVLRHYKPWEWILVKVAVQGN